MSTHPNAILMVVFTPQDLARKTFKNIVLASGGDPEDEDVRVKIGGSDYTVQVMEDAYDESCQISANEGDIVVSNFVTYGYGEKIEWNELSVIHAALSGWAKAQCEKFHCSHKIYVSANYW